MHMSDLEFETVYGGLLHSDSDDALFEIEYDDYDLIDRHLASKTLWTLVEGEDEKMWLLPGLHRVNRLSLHISQLPGKTKI